jgi:hypothetical protein
LFLASRYNREEVVASLGREINLNPPLTLGKYLLYLFAGFECVPIRLDLWLLGRGLQRDVVYLN